jgi:hypothetical protein
MSLWHSGTALGAAFAAGLGGGLILATLASAAPFSNTEDNASSGMDTQALEELPTLKDIPGPAKIDVLGADEKVRDFILAANPLYPDPRAMPERDIATPPAIEQQMRSAINGCRIEGSVRGTQLSAIIRC